MPEVAQLYNLLRRATLIPTPRAITPEVGDIVIECSRFSPDPTMIGTLERIEGQTGEEIYHVVSLDGEPQRWINCSARTVQMKGTKLA